MPISAVFWRGVLFPARNFGGPPHRNLLAAGLCPARVAPTDGSSLYAYLLMVDGAVSHADLVHSTCRHVAGLTVIYSTSPRNGNRVHGHHLDICLSSPQKNGN